MILCVTLNPALDRTLVVPNFASGGVFRSQEYSAVAGGKGINVARAAQILGEQALCAGCLGGFTGQYVAAMVEQMGLASHWTLLQERETRTCVILVDPHTLLTTVVNEPGPMLSATDWESIHQDIHLAAKELSLISFSGSLPPGLPVEGFANLLAELIASGKEVWLDSSGAPLEAASRIKGLAIKINDDEASALTKIPIHSPDDAVNAAGQIMQQTQQTVVITMGKSGAVMLNKEIALQAIAPELTIKSSVGSGDSFFAGLLVAMLRRASWEEALAQASAAGTANCLSIGGGAFTRVEFEEILLQTRILNLS
jgi:1-phosphofructokinase family hexose kinase